MRRPWILILAAVVLGAPSCPRETGPGDYDPDATRPFTGVPADSDLLYLSAGSSRGDVVYVIAANTGATVGRIDGPDRLSWAVDPAGRVGYYAVTRREGPTTLHRIDLRSGVRRLLARDDRAGVAEGLMLDDGWRPTVLAVTGDGTGLLVARALANGFAWVGRYDTTTGALTEQLSWPLQERGATVRLDWIGGERFVAVVSEARDGSVVRQHLHVIDGRLRPIADVTDAGLPATTPCASRLVPVAEGWGTVCSWNDRYPVALFLDAAFRPLRTITLPVGPAEQLRAHAAVDGGLGVLTDRGRWALVRGTSATLSNVSLLDGRTTGSAVLRPLGATGEGLVLGHVVGMGEPSDRTLALIDLARGRTIAERRLEGGLVSAAIGRDVYALTGDSTNADALRLWRFDRATLEPRGAGVTVPQRDLAMLGGIALVVAR